MPKAPRTSKVPLPSSACANKIFSGSSMRTTFLPSRTSFRSTRVLLSSSALPRDGCAPSKITSAVDPSVHSESESFALGYLGALLTFRTTGPSLEEAGQNNGSVRRSRIYCRTYMPVTERIYRPILHMGNWGVVWFV